MSERAYVALGSNLGDRAAYLDVARRALARLPKTSLVAVSSVEETVPLRAGWGGGGGSEGGEGREAGDGGEGGEGGPYLNQMALLETDLTPRELLEACLAIERRAGRERRAHWGPRTLDLDIVRFGNRALMEPDLVVPHPELPLRDFWQRELKELERYVS